MGLFITGAATLGAGVLFGWSIARTAYRDILESPDLD